jgi:hypothetical protein
MKMEHKSQRKSSQVSTSGDSHREKRKLISNLPYRDFLSSTDFFSNIFFFISQTTREHRVIMYTEATDCEVCVRFLFRYHDDEK